MVVISVIIPIYNSERYLTACLESVCAQSVGNVEILAVNNGCTDHCPEILQAFAQNEPRIRVITIPHGKIADARNAGLQRATGRYIAFCDSDDTLPPNAYRHLLENAERNKSDIVIGRYCEIMSDGTVRRNSLTHHIRKGAIGLIETPCLWNKLIRREFVEKHRIAFQSLIVGEDFLFLGNILKQNPRVSYSPHLTYFYWIHENQSVTHRYTLELFKGHLECRKAFLQVLQGSRWYTAACDHVFLRMTSYLKNYLFYLWTENDREEAFFLLQKYGSGVYWNLHEDVFLRIFGMPRQQFLTITAQLYMTSHIQLSHREVVLSEIQAGAIGFRYIAAYTRAWLGLKIKNIKQKQRKR